LRQPPHQRELDELAAQQGKRLPDPQREERNLPRTCIVTSDKKFPGRAGWRPGKSRPEIKTPTRNNNSANRLYSAATISGALSSVLECLQKEIHNSFRLPCANLYYTRRGVV
jgi:hypothetical protein